MDNEDKIPPPTPGAWFSFPEGLLPFPRGMHHCILETSRHVPILESTTHLFQALIVIFLQWLDLQTRPWPQGKGEEPAAAVTRKETGQWHESRRWHLAMAVAPSQGQGEPSWGCHPRPGGSWPQSCSSNASLYFSLLLMAVSSCSKVLLD